jgi:hypothetical protein
MGAVAHNTIIEYITVIVATGEKRFAIFINTRVMKKLSTRTRNIRRNVQQVL